MLIFVSGAVRSGKSALGESLVHRYASGGRKVYLATTEAYDGEMERRIVRHRADRAGKGFFTVEMGRTIENAVPMLRRGDTVLLDCLGALASNEMFGAAYVESATDCAEALSDKIFSGIMAVHAAVSALVVISNEVFSDGIEYDTMTLDYIRLMGLLHCRLVAVSDAAVECAAGMHIVHKGALKTAL